MINRRTFIATAAVFASLPSLPAAAARSEPRHFRRYFPPVRFNYEAEAFFDANYYRDISHWHYEPLVEAPGDVRGVIQHLRTGFTYYTVPDTKPADPLLNMQMAYMLFPEGESMRTRLAERRRIGRAAALVATFTADYADESLYIGPPPGIDADDERPAPPFIVGKTSMGFLLRL